MSSSYFKELTFSILKFCWSF